MSEFSEAVLKVTAQKLRVTRDGKTSEITRLSALLEKEHERGLKGGAGAQAHALRRIERALAEKEADVAVQCDYWAPVKRRFLDLLADAKKKGVVPPRLFPHPDDIVIDRSEGVRIIGPVDEEDRAFYDQTLKMRTALYLQDRVEARECVSATDGGPGVTSPLILAVLLNDFLPPSLRQTKQEQLAQLRACQCLPMRAALKDCRSAWRAAGVAVPRGKKFSPTAVLVPILRIVMDFANDSTLAGVDPLQREEAMQRAEYRLMTEVLITQPRRNLAVQSQNSEPAQ